MNSLCLFILTLDKIRNKFAGQELEIMQCSNADLSHLIDSYFEYELSIDGILKEIEQINRDELVKQASSEQSRSSSC